MRPETTNQCEKLTAATIAQVQGHQTRLTIIVEHAVVLESQHRHALLEVIHLMLHGKAFQVAASVRLLCVHGRYECVFGWACVRREVAHASGDGKRRGGGGGKKKRPAPH